MTDLADLDGWFWRKRFERAKQDFHAAVEADDIEAARAACETVEQANAEGARVCAFMSREITPDAMHAADLATCASYCKVQIAETKAELLVLRLVVETGQDGAAAARQRIPRGEFHLEFLE
jgi:hypothetical protein